MVIQRWQSVMLLFACVLMACFSFLSLAQIQTEDFTFNVTTMGVYYEGEPTGNAPSGVYIQTIYFFALSLLSAFLPFLTIFFFKNLRLQIKLCSLEMILLVTTIIVCIFDSAHTIDGGNLSWSSIICAPFLALIFTIAASYFIRRDRNLLRSADRLR